jgi:hypothetical protein
LILLVGAAALTVAANPWLFGEEAEQPWQRSWLGNNGARYAQIARNYTRYGLTHLGGAPLIDPGVHDPERPDVYAHHPPALGMVLAVVFNVVGVSEAAARFVAWLATLGCLALLTLLVADLAGWRAGGVAALAAASMPMVSLYGAHVDVQGAPVLLFSLATLLTYRRWRQGRAGLAPVLVASAAASAFDWYGLYAPAGCALHLLVTRRERRGAAVGLAAWTALLFGVWLAWLLALPGMSFARMGQAAAYRTTGLFADPGVLLGYVQAWLMETLELMPGWPALLLVAVAAMAGAWRPAGEVGAAPAAGGLGSRGLVALLTLPPLIHGAMFPQGLLVHGYWLFALPYGLAVALALGLERLRPAVVVVVLLVLVLAGRQGLERQLAPERVNVVALEVGRLLGRVTVPSAVILTNYDTNPFNPGLAAGYSLKRPAVTWYADRVIRGGVETAPALEEALRLRPDATHFLLTPPPRWWLERAPPPELKAALEQRAIRPPRRIEAPVEIWLYALR